MKHFADDSFKFDENGGKFSKRVENTVGQEEIARYEIYPFPMVFLKDLYTRHKKTRACLEKVGKSYDDKYEITQIIWFAFEVTENRFTNKKGI